MSTKTDKNSINRIYGPFLKYHGSDFVSFCVILFTDFCIELYNFDIQILGIEVYSCVFC